ncbi:uncharacterized protein BDR25DRAFT_90890 [Lindgomyces ingoldianus]|uniref:Uncharacterized protein n=1 Tax=Lindgomyces ingoldianus TaxID=673940 RepID=A0ACB6RA63_9PLEO|nr:uncharacterized protein BDR25DRAFT_90890 [Lindgomyces ingoldianus]KAF2476139.1 hypothetical protein BDR25DRAFT_90890 [Lindgomyces ingoldianus]
MANILVPIIHLILFSHFILSLVESQVSFPECLWETECEISLSALLQNRASSHNPIRIPQYRNKYSDQEHVR